jgi:hypothetical protein
MGAVCDEQGTGYVLTTGGAMMPCARWICVNLTDPEILLEYKAVLGSVNSGAVVDHHVPHWTPNDEAALYAWGSRSDVDVPGWFEGDLFDRVGGHVMPNGHSIRGMLQELGYPDNAALYSYYPILVARADAYTDSDCWDTYLEVRHPLVGAATPLPSGGNGGRPGGGADEGNGDGPTRAGMTQTQAIGYGVAGAFVVATVVMLYRGRA